MTEDQDRVVRVLYLALAASAYGLWSACAVGDPAPFVARLRRIITAPRPGDLVLEVSSFRRMEDLRSRIGDLVRVTEEPIRPPGEWDEEAGGEPPPTERVFYVRMLDGATEVRWANADFIRVFRSWDEFYQETRDAD